MAEPEHVTPDLVVRQLQQHFDSLRSAGVDWLPRADPHQEPPRPENPVVQAVVLSPDAPEQRRIELDLLATEVAACVRCPSLASTRTQTVFGVGPLDPELCFVGEAPGEQEDKLGQPFVGPAGQLLDRIIGACGMKRDDVYILNILRCRPPGNRKPTAAEAHNCRGFLERQLEIIRPKYLCALGATAAQHLLGSSLGIGKLRGRFHDFNGMPVICTYHPSYLLRLEEPAKTNTKREVWNDMKLLLAKMGRDVPAK
jgi:uracil-DNA glycosylase family 4